MTTPDEAGHKATAITPELSRRGIKPRGSTTWTPADVRKLLRRLDSGS